jgi:tetratricopeptide (TPR) repeat protein
MNEEAENIKEARLAFEAGLTHMTKSEWNLALKKFSEALKKGGARPSIIQNLAIANIKLRKYDEASSLIATLEKIQPDTASTPLLYAQLCWETGRPVEALNWTELASFDISTRAEAAALHKKYFLEGFPQKSEYVESDKKFRAAISQQIRGRLSDARDALLEAIEVYPSRTIYWEHLACISIDLDDRESGDKALTVLDKITPVGPIGKLAFVTLSNRHFNLNVRKVFDELLNRYGNIESIVLLIARLYVMYHQYALALKIYCDTIKINPTSTVAKLGMAKSLANLGDLKNSADILDSDPNLGALPEYWELRAFLSFAVGRLHSALEYLNVGVRQFPIPYLIRYRAFVHKNLGHTEKAISDYLTVIKTCPTDPVARNHLGLIYLFKKFFYLGWPLYDSRWLNTSFTSKRFVGQIMRWERGVTSGALLVWAEQGVGDEVFYARFLRPLREYFTGTITFLCDKRLAKLLSMSFYGVECISEISAEKTKKITAQISVADLPRYFLGPEGAVNFYTKPYLNPFEPGEWKIDEKKRKPRIGLSWRSLNNAHAENKSLSIEHFATLLEDPNFSVLSIQYGDVSNDIETYRSRAASASLQTIGAFDVTEDLLELSKVLTNLDAVVTVSNVNAHIAGALGVKVYLLVPFALGRMWFWHEERVSCWYPTVRLYVQSADGTWDVALEQLLNDLRLACPNQL